MTRGGRPSSYRKEYAEQAAKLCELGATDHELADFFEVSVRTMHRWKLEHPEFCHALKAGKSVADDRVERSLLERASGYRYVEQQAVKVRLAGGGEEVQIVDVERVAPPDTTAMIFWLKNRRSDQWRDVHKVEHGRPGDFDSMSDDELDAYIARGQGAYSASDNGERKTAGQKGVRGKSSGLH